MRNSRLLTLITVFFVMVFSCETAITDCTYPDASETVSAGSENKVSKNMKIQVSEQIAEILLQGRDASGNISQESMIKAGYGIDSGIESMRTTFMIGGKFEQRQRASGLHQWFNVVFSDEIVDTKATVELPGLEIIHEAPVYKINELVNDPDFTKQWHYWNQGSSVYAAGHDIKLKEAWEIYGEYGNNEVIVAVFDSGIDCEHPDLHGNMWVNELEKNGVEGIDDDHNGYVDDVYGYNFAEMKGMMSPADHGTHVAGTVSAVNNNGIGVAGVAGGRYPKQGVRIMAVQVIHDSGSADFERAAQYAADNGAVIAQNSWGYQGNVRYIFDSDKRAIDYFIDYAGIDDNGQQIGPMKGGLMVFSTGNDAKDFGYPAQYERALAVASLGPDGKAAYYTNYGDWVDVCAPGGNQSYGQEAGVYSTVVGGGYAYMQGTSMACPHVSGLAALILSRAKGEGYTSQQLYDHIVSTTNTNIYTANPTYEGMLGSGMINAVNAFAKFSTIAPAVPECQSYSVLSNAATFIIDVPIDEDDRKAYYYDIYFHSEEVTEANVQLAEKYRIAISGLEDGQEGTKKAVIKGLDFDTDYHWAVAAVDYAGNVSALGTKGTLSTGPNAKPVISVSEDTEIVLTSRDEVSRIFTYSDPDGHAVTVTFQTTSDSGVEYSEISEGIAVMKISGSDSVPGTYEFTFTVTDEYGLSEVYKREYVVLDNSAPEVVKQIGTVNISGVNSVVELPLKDYFKDVDGDQLSAKFSIKDKNVVSASFSKNNIVLTGMALGTTEVTVTVSDPSGAEASSKFTVVVRDPSKPYVIYPNPVITVMNIQAYEEQETVVKLYSTTGQNVYETEAKLSGDKAFTADLSGIAPGRYTLVIEPVGGTSYSTSIVKL